MNVAVVTRRGRLGAVCARGACPTRLSGPSTSPLGAMHTQPSSVITFWAIFGACTALVSFVAHRCLKSSLSANLLAALVIAVGLASFDTIRLGYLDGWLIVAAPIAGTMSLELACSLE